jgi:Fic family protein
LLETIVRRIILLKSDYEVLCWVPLTKAVLNWDKHRMISGRNETMTFDKDVGTGIDCTCDVENIFSFILEGIQALEKMIEDSRKSEDQLLKNMTSMHTMNLRQKHILRLIMEMPQRNLSIETHRKMYGVSYATARSDLLDLVSMGFLVQYKDSRAFIFKIHPSMLQNIKPAALETPFSSFAG